eukprot:2314730-Prymnesium_polylepis.1
MALRAIKHSERVEWGPPPRWWAVPPAPVRGATRFEFRAIEACRAFSFAHAIMRPRLPCGCIRPLR